MTINNSKQAQAKKICYTESDKAFLEPLEENHKKVSAALEVKTESDNSDIFILSTATIGAAAGSFAPPLGSVLGGAIGYFVGDIATNSKAELTDDLAKLDSKLTPIHASCELLANAMQNIDESHWPAVKMALHNVELKAQVSNANDPVTIVENLNAARAKLATCVKQLYSTDNSNGFTNNSSNIQQNASPQIDNCMSQ
jgi:hypothetical protein